VLDPAEGNDVARAMREVGDESDAPLILPTRFELNRIIGEINALNSGLGRILECDGDQRVDRFVIDDREEQGSRFRRRAVEMSQARWLTTSG